MQEDPSEINQNQIEDNETWDSIQVKSEIAKKAQRFDCTFGRNARKGEDLEIWRENCESRINESFSFNQCDMWEMWLWRWRRRQHKQTLDLRRGNNNNNKKKNTAGARKKKKETNNNK